MIDFSIPLKNNNFFSFSVESRRMLFAGSRNINLDQQLCLDLINAFGSLGFSFLTGCAEGVDRSFCEALALSNYRDRTLVACAFRERVKIFRGIFPLYVVPSNLPPKVALAKRTLWMTSSCALLILFPSNPIGKGSSLAFKSTIMSNKPVFIVTKTRPAYSDLYSVFPSNLFGVIDGYWCIPPVYQDTGLCYEAV